MPITVTIILVIIALITAIANAMGKCPVWIPITLVCIVLLLQVLPR